MFHTVYKRGLPYFYALGGVGILDVGVSWTNNFIPVVFMLLVTDFIIAARINGFFVIF